MKTAWNLNRDKALGMQLLIQHLLESWPPEDQAEKLLHLIVKRICIRLRNSLDRVNAKNNYRITLPPEEAIAFGIWFNQHALPEGLYKYETHVAQQLCSEIDRVYG